MAGYDVSVNVDGSYDRPDVTLTSTPPLPNEDLLVLLLTGQPPAGAWTREASAAAAQSYAYYLGQDVITDWFAGLGGDREDAESFFDRVEWQTGSDISRTGRETGEISLRLSEDRPGPGRTVYLRGERDVYDFVNYGVRILFRIE
jgi:translocation and assembly module TamB